MAIASFHFSTLEEYYTGGLFLGPGNGVSDGSATVIAGFIVMGIYGNEWTLYPIKFISPTFLISDACIYFVGFANTVIVLLCIRSVFTHQHRTIVENEITGEVLVKRDFFM